MLEYYNLYRIGVKSKGRRVYIPRHVFSYQYDANICVNSSGLLDKHEAAIMACLRRPFFIDELHSKYDLGYECMSICALSVKVMPGEVFRRKAVVKCANGKVYARVYFYVPVIDINSERLGYVEIRNVESLFHMVRKLVPDVQTVSDL